MSWHGTHPIMSAADARERLPPAACRRCVYWVRQGGGVMPWSCERCGGRSHVRDLSTFGAGLFVRLFPGQHVSLLPLPAWEAWSLVVTDFGIGKSVQVTLCKRDYINSFDGRSRMLELVRSLRQELQS